MRQPSRNHVVKSASRNRKLIPSCRWHNQKLVPGLPQVRRVHHALAIRRKRRPRLPVGFLIMNLLVMSIARLGAWLRFHPPESARAMNVSPIRDKENLRAIPRPHGADLVIDLTVVITRQRTDVLRSKLPHIAK